MAGAIANAGRTYQAAVIGAGPAGLALVATLLDAGTASILWVDPAFNAGRLERYVEVPSNTKVKLFTQYATVSPALAAISASAIGPLQGLDPDKGCSLKHAKHMVAELSSAIRSQYKDKVDCQQGTVSSLVRQGDGSWQLDGFGCSQEVYLATGSHPRSSLPGGAAAAPVGSTNGPRVLDLDDMLSPTKLAQLVKPSDVVGVVGSSHSAILVLHNLLDAPQPPKKVINVYRSPLLYAKHMDNWILYDNTGLKGFAADWAKEKLEQRVYEQAGRLERVCVKDDPSATQEALSRCTAVVYGVGFDANPTPKIIAQSGGEALRKIEYDRKTGRIKGADGVRGFGIAFPEQVTDPHGNVELAVGMWKFMRYVRETLLPQKRPSSASSQQDGTRAA